MWRELQPDDPGRIGPYRLRGVLGSGGMGRVFLGVSADGDQVAVKVIRADLAMDPEFRARFRREVTVARKVSSRFTAPLIGADADGPVPWLATAYVTGPSLADAVAQRGPLPAASVLELAAGLAEGVSAIHSAGVIHRDLKPSNVLLAQDGPRVIDFGISVAAETSPLTRTGLLIGSPGYMSPEQVEGRAVGPASDIFSLGAVLAFAATGEAPFGNGSAPTLAYRAVYRQVNLDRVPAEVRGLIDRCLAKDPGQRPAARDLMFAAGAGAIPPTERWVPALVTRTFTELQADQDGSRTVTSVRLSSPVSQPAPGRPGRQQDRQQGREQGREQGHRQRRRPLAIASVVVGILAASAAGGIAVAGCTSQTVGVHSVSSPITSAPTTSAPSTSPTAIVAP
ncbi:MAG TPA: serine/threonine-protein kinase, partial [Streptosporangiaceae bacterium]|nr:serine/threonine-protein kinase [Streptosporangiaceae bacterium]